MPLIDPTPTVSARAFAQVYNKALIEDSTLPAVLLPCVWPKTAPWPASV